MRNQARTAVVTLYTLCVPLRQTGVSCGPRHVDLYDYMYGVCVVTGEQLAHSPSPLVAVGELTREPALLRYTFPIGRARACSRDFADEANHELWVAPSLFQEAGYE
jgi:hypothetical protein